jgi:poly-gamma-glutamate synthesis protein (capsule biosynthesis protein)
MTLLLFGDVNLGRNLGKEILKGKVDFPFRNVRSILRGADGVFVNLESPLTDQNGETESPLSNYVFCGPPEGAKALRRGGVTLVSTANNHAFDYSLKGLLETIRSLDSEGIRHVGTSIDSVRFFRPVVLRRHGIRVGFLAYTEFVNGTEEWKGRISVYDSVRARKEISWLRRSVDFVIVSFHGGSEYGETPRQITLRRIRNLISAGADVVVGHHPHVPQGIEEFDGKLIFYSLGNFVFNQSDTWAKRSFGVELKLLKSEGQTAVESVRLIPIRPYKQPSVGLPEPELQQMIDRLRKTSNVSIVSHQDSIFVTSLELSHLR